MKVVNVGLAQKLLAAGADINSVDGVEKELSLDPAIASGVTQLTD